MSEQILKEILSEIKSMKSEMNSIKKEMVTKSEFNSIKQEVDSIKKQMVTKEDIDETNRILGALEHRSQVQGAEIEQLRLSTASKESIDRIETTLDRIGTDLSYLVRKAVQHDDDIRELRRAK